MHLSFAGGTEYGYVLFSQFCVTLDQMVFDWAAVVDMLSEAGLHVSAGLANIARDIFSTEV